MHAQVAARIVEARGKHVPEAAGAKWKVLEKLAADAAAMEARGEFRKAVHAWSRTGLYLRALERNNAFCLTPEGDVRLGEVTLHRKLRMLSFPAVYRPNPEMPVEVICCREHAERAYETLFTTRASPLHLQTLLILLGARNGAAGPHGHGIPQGDLFDILVEYEDGSGRTRRIPVERLLTAGNPANPLPRDGWVFVGSTVKHGRFAADSIGELILGWAANPTVLQSANAAVASGELSLECRTGPEAPLRSGQDVRIWIVPRAGASGSPHHHIPVPETPRKSR